MCLQGREQILHVHARGKRLTEGLDLRKVARATAGFTGADLMNLMNTSAVLAVRQGQSIITEPLMFQVGPPFVSLLCCIWFTATSCQHETVSESPRTLQGTKRILVLRTAINLPVQALENIHQERMGHFGTASQYEETALVPPALRKGIAVYHGAKALLGALSPEYDELSKVQHALVTCNEAHDHRWTCILWSLDCSESCS